MNEINKKAVFVGLARNVAEFLPGVLNNIESLSALFNNVFTLFIENDSTDNTKNLLKEWIQDRPAKLIELDGLAERYPKRTERIAFARNHYLEIIAETGLREFDYLIVLDMDAPNSFPLEISRFAEAIGFLEESGAGGVFANQVPLYYDIWALREKSWCPGDCWAEVAASSTSMPYSEAIQKYIYSRQKFIDPAHPPIAVDSAFGGLGIYKMAEILNARYAGVTPAGSEVCEHVALHLAMRARGKGLFIVPSLLNMASIEHTVLSHTHCLMPLSANGREIHLLAGKDHQLGNYRAQFPLYDERFPILAGLYSQQNAGVILDIGANIGDGLALCRLHGCKNRYICIEGYEPFFMLLAANAFINRSIFSDCQLINKFVDIGSKNIAIMARSGTATLTDSPVDGQQVEANKVIKMSELIDDEIGFVKIDTDGNDARIILNNLDFLHRQRPILWSEAEVFSKTGLEEWSRAIAQLAKIYRYVVIFDNFGFAITAGEVTRLVPFMATLFRYIHHQRVMSTEQYGVPKIYYTDVVFFSEKDEALYQKFLSTLKELGDIGNEPIGPSDTGDTV